MNVLMSRNGLVPLELCVSALRKPENVILQKRHRTVHIKDIDYEYQNFIVDHY